jgi:hypothetical protein
VLPAPLALAIDPVEPAPAEPALEPVEPAALGLDAVLPVDDPPAAEPVEPVDPAVEPVEPVAEPAAPLGADPVDPAPDGELMAPPLAEPAPEILALVSMNELLPLAEPVVPVAPVVPVVDALLPAPDPDTRHPVAITVCPLLLPLVCDPLVLCAAAPAPSATAIMVPKRNCRFITSSVLIEMRCLCTRHGPFSLTANAGPLRPVARNARIPNTNSVELGV